MQVSGRPFKTTLPSRMLIQSTEIPRFVNEDEEREFWATHDSSEYIDWDEASAAVFPQLRPTTKSISLLAQLPIFNE